MPKLALFALALLSACQLPAPQPEPWDHLKLEGYSANGIDVTLPQRRYVFDARGGSQSIAGECVNGTGTHLRACEVQLEVLDEDGSKVGWGMAVVTDLAPGQTWRFGAPVSWSQYSLVGAIRVSRVSTSPTLVPK